jgi:hypothetical protein
VLEGEAVLRTRDTPQAGPVVPAGSAVPSTCGVLVPISPKCKPAYENLNTTRGTLLVLRMCMKLVIFSSRTRGFDNRIFVVRTVNSGGGNFLNNIF